MDFICRTNRCGMKAVQANKRGLCMGCYASAKTLVENGTTTWAELEESELVAKPVDLFTKAVLEMQEKKKNAGNQ